MEQLKKIMVAVDFSKYSEKLVAVSVDLAQKLSAELIFINVINQRELQAVEETLNRLSMYEGSISISDYVEEVMTDRREKMKALLDLAGWEEGKPYHLFFKKGVPFEQLVKAAHKDQIDLMVMASKGRTNIGGVLFGSTAEKMFRHCPVTLMSVREKKENRVIW